jgi:hypothetical protein
MKYIETTSGTQYEVVENPPRVVNVTVLLTAEEVARILAPDNNPFMSALAGLLPDYPRLAGYGELLGGRLPKREGADMEMLVVFVGPVIKDIWGNDDKADAFGRDMFTKLEEMAGRLMAA